MNDSHVTTVEELEDLPTGQWVKDADGNAACLMITHMGFPQRMWGFKKDGGTKGFMVTHIALSRIVLPLHLGDADTDACKHPRTNECGQCEVCGLVGVDEARPLFIASEDMSMFRAVAAHNARIGGDQ